MTNIFKLLGVISVDGLDAAKRGLAQLDTQFKAADKALVKFGRQSQRIGMTLTKGFTVPIAAMGFAAYKGVQAASDLNETVSKVGQIFGASGEEIVAWSKTTAASLGQSQQSAMDAAATFATFGKSAGKTGTELVKFSKQFVGLSSDLASFYNTSPEEAITAIGAAMRGENEPIRKYGILLDDASMRQEALRLGIISTVKDALNPQQKVLAASALIIKQTSDAQGDFARTSTGLANQQRILKAEISNLTAEFGTSFLPIALQVVKIFQDNILPQIKAAVQWFGSLSDETKKNNVVTLAIVAALGPLSIALGQTIMLTSQMAKVFGIAKLAFTGLTVAMAVNPITAIGIAAATATVAVLALVNAQKQLKEAENFDEKITDRQEAYSRTIEDLAYITDVLNTKIGDKVKIKNEEYTVTAAAIANAKKEKAELEKYLEAIRGGDATFAAYKKAKESATAPGKDAKSPIAKTQEELDAIAKMNQENADKLAAITNNKLEENDRLRKKEVADTIAAKGDVALVEQRYALQAEQITADEAKARTEKYKKEKTDAEAAAKEINDINVSWEMKVFEQKGQRVKALELERVQAIEAAKQTGASLLAVNEYYINEIHKAKEEARNKEKSLLGGTIKDWLGAFQQIGAGISEIFSMSTDNRIAEVDNWENAERQAIERSTDSERTKSKKIERLDQEAESKRMEIKKKAAKQSKAISLFESVIGTGAAVVGALGMKPWTPFNFILAGIVGALGVAKTAMIAAQPLPFAEGGVIKGGKGGVQGLVGEGSQDELIMPLKTGIATLADGIMARISGAFGQSPMLAFAGAGGGNAGAGGNVYLNLGTFIGDDRSLKELERKLLPLRASEQQRKGQS